MSPNFIFALCIFFTLILSNLQLKSQTQHQLWTRFTINQPINDRWSVALELQHRRYNWNNDNGYFPLRRTLLNSVRTWVNYRLDKWTIILSPVAFFDYRMQSTAGNSQRGTREWRSMAGASYQNIGGNFFTVSRLLYEFSSINQDSAHFIRHRYRMQLNMWVPFIRKNNAFAAIQIGDELFLRTIKSASGFDQNRIFTGLRLQKKQNFILTGVQFTRQRSGSADNRIHQYLVAANVTMRNNKHGAR